MKYYLVLFVCVLAVIGEGLAQKTFKAKPNSVPSDFLKLKWAVYYVRMKAYIRNNCFSNISDAQKSGNMFQKNAVFPLLQINDIPMKTYMELLISEYENDVKQFSSEVNDYVKMFGKFLNLNEDNYISRDEYLEDMGCHGYYTDEINGVFDALGPVDDRIPTEVEANIWYEFFTNPAPTDSAIALAKAMLDSV